MGCRLQVAEMCLKRSGRIISQHVQSMLLRTLGEGTQKRFELKQDHSQTLEYGAQNQTIQRLGKRKLVSPGRRDFQDPPGNLGSDLFYVQNK